MTARVGLVYDTSFLMLKDLDGPPWYFRMDKGDDLGLERLISVDPKLATLRDKPLPAKIYPEEFRLAVEQMVFARKQLWLGRVLGLVRTIVVGDAFSVEEVLPIEVLAELRRHFSNEEKSEAARRGRKRVAIILERGAREIALKASDTDRSISFGNDTLSVDSATDRLLLEYSITQVRRQNWTAAVIATDDGGILYDIVKIRKAGVKLVAFSKERWDSLRMFFSDVLIESGHKIEHPS